MHTDSTRSLIKRATTAVRKGRSKDPLPPRAHQEIGGRSESPRWIQHCISYEFEGLPWPMALFDSNASHRCQNSRGAPLAVLLLAPGVTTHCVL